MARFTLFRNFSVFIVAASVLIGGLNLGYSNDVRNYPPALESGDEVLQYVAYIRRVLPEVFQPGGAYHVDPLVVVQREQALLKVLHSNEVQAVYQAELPKQRHPYQKLEVTIHESELETQTKVSASGAESLKHSFAELAHRYPNAASLDNVIVKLFQSTGLGSQGLLTGLIQCLPPEFKATAFKLAPEEKLEYVRQHLSDQDLRAKFRTTVYKPEEIRASHLLNEYRRLEEVERSLGRMALYREWTRAGATEEALSRLGTWTSENVQSSIHGLALDAKDGKRLRELVQNATQAQLKVVTEDVQGSAWKPRSTFTIEEVSPNIGIFRGAVNGDCFTAYTYGFCYSPAERTYLVRDENGKLLTAVYATSVDGGGKPSLYIHDLGSSKLSPFLSGDIFKAFYTVREKLGFDQILLTSRNMHFSQFKSAAEAVARDAGTVSITYTDIKTRTKIGDTLVEHIGRTPHGADYPKRYDLPGANQKARIFVPKANDKERVDVQTTQFHEPVFSARALSDAERTDLILDLLARDQSELAQSAFKGDVAPEARAGAATEIKAALLNLERRPVQDYLKHLAQVLASHGLHSDASVSSGKAQFLAQGYLMAPDCWQGPNSAVSRQTLEFITQLANENPADHLITTVTKEHPEIVRSTAFEKLFRSFMKDNAMSMAKAKGLMPCFNVYPQLTPAIQELLFNALEFKFSQQPPQFIISALIKAKVEPTEPQLEILARGMEKQMARMSLLDLIDNSPATWKEPLLKKLSRYVDDPFAGDRITLRLLAAGVRTPGVESAASRWKDKNPYGLTAQWLDKNKATCVANEVMAHLK